MFKNIFIYRIGRDWPASASQLEEALATEPFVECGATQQKSAGWVPPRGEEHGALVEVVGGQWIARFAIETKTAPGEAVRKRADELVAQVERSTGRKPGRSETRDLRDQALLELLPHAFPRRSHISVWIEPERRWLVVDAGSQGKADDVITGLVRVAGQGFSVGHLQTATSPTAAMTAWLADAEGDALPHAFSIERECELKGGGEEPARVRFDRHSLQTDEVRQHIAEGKLPTRLALSWAGRVGFTLTHTLQLKKITFDHDQVGKPDENEDRFDADVALATGELSGLLVDLIDALGGEPEVT